VTFADVAVTDLIETEEFGGTLGRSEGDPVLSRIGGTITATAAEGATITQGDVLYEVDGEPVVLLFGDQPAWRTLASSPDPETIAAGSPGTITAAPADGDTIAQGEILYEIDGEPVLLLYGDTPAFRTLRQDIDEGADIAQLETALVELGYDPDGTVTVDEDFTANTEAMVERWQEDVGVEVDGVVDFGDVVFLPGAATVESVTAAIGGPTSNGQPVLSVTVSTGEIAGDDVAQLEEALAALGYDPGPVDGTFDDRTSAAVSQWQTALGTEADGVVHLGEVVFLPGPIRVTSIDAPPGTPTQNGGTVLATSSAETVVIVDLPAADQGTLVEGDVVAVILPDNTSTPATVAEVGTVATQEAGADPTFEVIVILEDSAAAAGLDEAPVDVEVVTDSRRGVLAVPVTALVALAEGGYAVELDQGGGHTVLVAVVPGFYADGSVEISSSDLEVGDRVVVP
jgi:peptidoglycan hydrolase-like protein with peptidoglycan-binding domain